MRYDPTAEPGPVCECCDQRPAALVRYFKDPDEYFMVCTSCHPKTDLADVAAHELHLLSAAS